MALRHDDSTINIVVVIIIIIIIIIIINSSTLLRCAHWCLHPLKSSLFHSAWQSCSTSLQDSEIRQRSSAVSGLTLGYSLAVTVCDPLLILTHLHI